MIDLNHGAQRLNLPSGMGMTRGLYYQYSERARTLDGVALYDTKNTTLTGEGDPERVRVARVTTTLGPLWDRHETGLVRRERGSGLSCWESTG